MFFLFQLDLEMKSEDGGDLSNFITNGEWYLLGKLTIAQRTIIQLLFL